MNSFLSSRLANLEAAFFENRLIEYGGYFKAAKSFFPPSAFHRRDLEYVARQLEHLGRPPDVYALVLFPA